MPSSILRQLRIEAEKVSPTNAQLLAHWRESEGMEFWKVESRASGLRRQQVMEIGSAVAGVGGSIGLIGIAMANQAAGTVAMYAGMSAAQTAAVAAAGLATSAGSFTTMMAGVGTALSGLGTVAVAGAVLPVAPVIAFGVAAAGAAGLLISKCMAVDISGGIEAAREHEYGLEASASLNPNGRSGPVAMGDWLRGAKNLITRGIAEVFSGCAQEETAENRYRVARELDAAARQQRWDKVRTDVVRSYMLSTGTARDVFIRCAESDLGVLPPAGLLLRGSYDDKKGGIAATVMDDALAYIEQFPADFKIEKVPAVSPLLRADATIPVAPRTSSRADADLAP